MKISLKELRAIVRNTLVEADEKKEPGRPKGSKNKEQKPKKEAIDFGFSCPVHNELLKPFFIKIQGNEDTDYDAKLRKNVPKGVLSPEFRPNMTPPTEMQPGMDIPQKYKKIEKRKIKFLYCPLREEEGFIGPNKVECDYTVIPRATRQGTEWFAVGEVARELNMVGVPLKKRLTQATEEKIPEAMQDELDRMEKGAYRWKRVKGDAEITAGNDPTNPKWQQTKKRGEETWVKVPMSKPKEYSGDDEHYLSYPYPMKLGLSHGKKEPAYYFSRDKVARAFVKLGWHMAKGEGDEGRKVAGPSMPTSPEERLKKGASKSDLGGKWPWKLKAHQEEPWHASPVSDNEDEKEELDDVDDNEEFDDIIPDRWK